MELLLKRASLLCQLSKVQRIYLACIDSNLQVLDFFEGNLKFLFEPHLLFGEAGDLQSAHLSGTNPLLKSINLLILGVECSPHTIELVCKDFYSTLSDPQYFYLTLQFAYSLPLPFELLPGALAVPEFELEPLDLSIGVCALPRPSRIEAIQPLYFHGHHGNFFFHSFKVVVL